MFSWLYLHIFFANCSCANKIGDRNGAQSLWTWYQSVVLNDISRDFGPMIAFGAKFQIVVTGQWGRKMSAPINRMRQIPFFPTPRFINSNNLYLNDVVLFPPFGTLKCVLVRCNLTFGFWTLQYLWLITASCETYKRRAARSRSVN